MTLFRQAGKTPLATFFNFLLLYLPSAAILTGALALAALYHESLIKEAVRLKEQNLIAMAGNILETDRVAHAKDAAFLSGLASMHLRVTRTDPKAVMELAKELSLFAETDRGYVRIRYLDQEGLERIRLEMTPQGVKDVAPPRPDPGTEALSPGKDASVSRFELVVTEQAPEDPASLVIRHFTPVFGPNGAFWGQLILDFDGTRLLNALRHETDRSNGSLWLLDSQGRWLIGPESVARFGVVSGDRNQSMRDLYPEAWERMAGKDKGQFLTDQGLFTFEIANLGLHEATWNWTVVTFVNPAAFVPEWLHDAIALHAALLFFLALIIWFWANAKTTKAAAEQALRLSERKLRAISESSLDAVIMIDGQGLVQYWNPAAERMFGYAAAEIMGRPCHDYLVPDEDRADATRGMADFVRTGKGRFVDKIVEVTGRRKNGETFPLELAVSPVSLDGAWGAVGSIRDITQRKIDEKRLWDLATTDGLTGAANRRFFMDAADKELEKAKRYEDAAAFIMLDVDNFKDINDAHGHNAGDDVLRELAEICRRNLREVDIFGRVGGEEFAVFMPRTDLDGAKRTAERLRTAVEAAQFTADGRPLDVSISLGVSILSKEADALDRLYKRADIALYAAKMGGRNRVEAA